MLRPYYVAAVLVSLALVAMTLHEALALPQVEFVCSVTATLSPTFNGTCTYCDTTGSAWFDAPDTTCSSPLPGNPPVDDTQQRWGTFVGGQPACFNNSGAGFRGLKDVTIITNPDNGTSTQIGVFTHYNNPITGNSPYRLRLTITVESSKLADPFIISYPLGFFETPNNPGSTGCDPSLQFTTVTCDDHFSFNTQIAETASFVYQNVRYTLELTGFIKDNSTTPIRSFSTQENTANSAGVYARLVTVCDSTLCGINEFFYTENCTCGCLLSSSLCSTTFGKNWTFDSQSCACACALDATTAGCPAGHTFNPDSCSCQCNLTDSYCQTINSTYQVVDTADGGCECGCSRDITLQCVLHSGLFYLPVASNSCACACAVTDEKCVNAFGQGYKADTHTCGCSTGGGGGLSGGDITGIVIGAVVGSVLLAALFIAGGALLVRLIRSGRVPGIYGYKFEPALLDGVSDSPLYNSPWSNNNPLN